MNHAAKARASRQPLQITIQNGKIHISEEVFSISKSNQEEVIWQPGPSNPNLQFTIEFKESPFYEPQFNNEYPVSGLARRDVQPDPKKVYKYTITAGGITKDPGGVITK